MAGHRHFLVLGVVPLKHVKQFALYAALAVAIAFVGKAHARAAIPHRPMVGVEKSIFGAMRPSEYISVFNQSVRKEYVRSGPDRIGPEGRETRAPITTERFTREDVLTDLGVPRRHCCGAEVIQAGEWRNFKTAVVRRQNHSGDVFDVSGGSLPEVLDDNVHVGNGPEIVPKRLGIALEERDRIGENVGPQLRPRSFARLPKGEQQQDGAKAADHDARQYGGDAGNLSPSSRDFLGSDIALFAILLLVGVISVVGALFDFDRRPALAGGYLSIGLIAIFLGCLGCSLYVGGILY